MNYPEGDLYPADAESTSPARSSAAITLADGTTHGFLLSNGTYTTIDYPNAIDTEALRDQRSR